ncbi:MAG: hypothetical protein FD166_2016 [Bacteroidetes bacterium]|nr:MAG: hypothetical protein FD166_2016 [Bacteroidota bacterium]
MKRRIYLVLLFIVPLVCFSQTLFRSGKFLHHSTGQNIWGPNGSSTSIPLQIQIYNANHGYTGTNAVSMVEQQWPLHPWQNEWERWHRIFDNQDPQANILPVMAANKIVVIKSCFPSSEMTGQGQPSDTLTPTVKSVYNYKWHWRNIVSVMNQHPGNFFVIWTNAPHLAVNTNPTAAMLSKKFTAWAKDTLAQGLDPEMGAFPQNVYVFHYFAKLSDANGYELPQYGISSSDSHPNALATALVDPQFVNEIFDAAIAYEQGGTTLTITPSSKNVTSVAGSTGFSVSCNTNWTAISNSEWCTATPSGTGNGTLYANYTANTGASPRTATVTISAPGATSQSVTVIQAGNVVTLAVTPASQNVAYSAGSTSFTVVSNTAWTATSGAAWCTVTPSGTGNGTIAAVYTVNTGTASRTAVITASATGAASQSVTVIQAGTAPALSVTPVNQSVTSVTGTTTFSVISNLNWTVQSNAGWCTSTTSGSGNATITAAYTANTGTTVRIAALTITATGAANQVVTVTQAIQALYLTATPSNQSVAAQAGSTGFSVTSNTNWTSLCNVDWCTVTSGGSGNGTLSANYTANSGSSSRTAVVTVSASGLSSVVLTVTQASSSPGLDVTPSSQNVTFPAGSTSFVVTSNTGWTAQSFSGWCVVTTSGSGNGTIYAVYTANSLTTSRTATIKVSSPGLSNHILTVVQSGALPVLSVTPPNQNATAYSGSKVFIVKSNTFWTVQDNSSWCTVTPSGFANGTITSVFSANQSALPRIATIEISATGADISEFVTVTQAGISLKESLAEQNLTVSSQAGSHVFSPGLTTGQALHSNVSWCRVASSVSDDGGFVAVYEENFSISPRTASITVSVEGSDLLTFNLTQSGIILNPMDQTPSLVRIFPNPSTGIVSMNIINPGNNTVQVVISDLLGRIVYEGSFQGDISESLDLGKEGRGIYAVLVSSGATIERSRIIVQ